MREGYIKSCVDCKAATCKKEDSDAYPNFCSSKNMITDEDKANVLDEYENGENKRIMAVAADVECRGYGKLTRVEEILEFAKSMGYRRLGIATCVGLLNESNVFAKIARKRGFEVIGLSCKAGEIRKAKAGIDEKCEAVGAFMCNPILQAKKLNEMKTELNIAVGLCVGHDSLFYKYSEAPVTTLITKDRVLAHNPAGALYQAEAYYKRLLD